MPSNKTVLICAVASGSVVLAVAGLWLYRRRKSKKAPTKPEELTKPVATIDKLCVYPMKSAYRVEVNEIECTVRGFKHDRCWVVTDDQKILLSQKRAPKLATIVQSVEEASDGSLLLVLNAPGYGQLRISPPDESTPYTSLSLFNISGHGQDVGDVPAEWISTCIGLEDCRIFYMSPDSKPRKPQFHEKYGDLCSPEDETSFANFSPVFLLSNSSLDELNTKMDTPMPITRFRPNIILSDCPPHEEDGWSVIRIGETCMLRLINPGPRCAITTVDQERGEPPKNNEPLKTLNTYRRYEQVYGEHNQKYTTGPLFGANYSVVNPGIIKLGDTVYTV